MFGTNNYPGFIQLSYLNTCENNDGDPGRSGNPQCRSSATKMDTPVFHTIDNRLNQSRPRNEDPCCSRSQNCPHCDYPHHKDMNVHTSTRVLSIANNSRFFSKDFIPSAKPSDKRGGGDADNNKKNNCPPKGRMNYEDMMSSAAANWVSIIIGVGVFLLFICIIYCTGSSSIGECFGWGMAQGCRDITNDNLKQDIGATARGLCGQRPGGKPIGKIPPHLVSQYNDFLTAVKNQGCHARNRENCPTLTNFAGYPAGGSVVSIRDTVEVITETRCRCEETNKLGKMCTPGAGDCSNCVCPSITAHTLLKEELIVPGKCWSFLGVGKVLIQFFFPIYVTGITLHHPAKSQLPPGFFSSSPKDFELWGYREKADKEPFFFGKFEYTETDAPSKIIKVQNLSPDKYKLVQFNFLSNHGNKNYTAVYKVEVHGLMDSISTGLDE